MLTKFNRTIVDADSGAVVPFARVSVTNQIGGAPAALYSDPDGTGSLGSNVAANENGFVGFFIDSGIYRIEARYPLPNDTVISVIEYEPVFNTLATNSGGVTLLPASQLISPISIRADIEGGGIVISLRNRSGQNPSQSHPAIIDIRTPDNGNVASSTQVEITSARAITISGGTDFGATNGQSRQFFVYAVYNESNFENIVLGVSLFTEIDAGLDTNTVEISTQVQNLINTASASTSPCSARLIGRVVVERGASSWASVISTTSYLGEQFYIDNNGRQIVNGSTAAGLSMTRLLTIGQNGFPRVSSSGGALLRSADDFRNDINAQRNRQNNLNATTNPTVSNDNTQGYEPLSLWINTTTNEIFQAISVSTGTANWQQATLTLDELGNVSLLNANAIGQNLITSSNPSAIRFLRVNADNTVSWLSAEDFRTAIGASGSSATHSVVNSTPLSANLSSADIRLRRSGNIVFFEARFVVITGNFDADLVGTPNAIPSEYRPDLLVKTASIDNGSISASAGFGVDFYPNGRVFVWFTADCTGQSLCITGSYFTA